MIYGYGYGFDRRRSRATPPATDVPDAFTAGMWSLFSDDASADVVINSLPNDHGSGITDVEYRIDGGAWTSTGGIGSFSIPGLTNGIAYNVELRAENGVGFSAASDVKQVTPLAIPANHRFIAPTLLGSGDGSSWANAAPLTDINAHIAALAAVGGTVAIASHLGDYSQTDFITLSAAGNVGFPVVITGMNASYAPAFAKIVGNRTDWTSPATEAGAVNAAAFGGNTLFLAAAGINRLHFKYLRFERLGKVIDFTGITADGFLFEDCEAYNLRDGIYLTATSQITNVVVRRFHATGFSKKFIRFRGTSHTWQVLDCNIDSRWQDGDDFAVGIECYDTAHGLLVNGGHTRNSRSTLGAYYNGDGISSERDNYDITIMNHNTSGHTDGGYDLKSEDTLCQDCVASDSKRNYRFWGGLDAPVRMVGCTSTNPISRGGSGGVNHIWMRGEDTIQAGDLICEDTTMLGGVDNMEAVTIEGSHATVSLIGTTNFVPTTGSVLSNSPDVVEIAGAATVPDAFVIGDWSINNAGTGSNAIVSILDRPHINGSGMVSLEWTSNAGANWTSLGGIDIGNYVINLGAPDIEYSVQLRAVNGVGASAAGDVKTVTPTAPLAVSWGSMGVRSNKAAVSTLDTITPALPPDLAEGDRLVIFAFSLRDSSTFVANQGYSLTRQNQKIAILEKQAGASEVDPTVTIGGLTIGDTISAVIMRFPGGGAGQDWSNATGDPSSVALPGPPLTVTAAGSAGVVVGVQPNDKLGVTFTANSWSEREYSFTTVGTDATFYIASRDNLGAGAQTMPSWSWAGGLEYRAISFAIPPL